LHPGLVLTRTWEKAFEFWCGGGGQRTRYQRVRNQWAGRGVKSPLLLESCSWGPRATGCGGVPRQNRKDPTNRSRLRSTSISKEAGRQGVIIANQGEEFTFFGTYAGGGVKLKGKVKKEKESVQVQRRGGEKERRGATYETVNAGVSRLGLGIGPTNGAGCRKRKEGTTHTGVYNRGKDGREKKEEGKRSTTTKAWQKTGIVQVQRGIWGIKKGGKS